MTGGIMDEKTWSRDVAENYLKEVLQLLLTEFEPKKAQFQGGSDEQFNAALGPLIAQAGVEYCLRLEARNLQELPRRLRVYFFGYTITAVNKFLGEHYPFCLALVHTREERIFEFAVVERHLISRTTGHFSSIVIPVLFVNDRGDLEQWRIIEIRMIPDPELLVGPERDV